MADPKTNNTSSTTCLKLFGFNILEDSNNNNMVVMDSSKTHSESNGINSSRKYECQYCCREFSNSQALGGHQNAHKRERQLLKRAHIQAATRNLPYSSSSLHSFQDYLLAAAAQPAATSTFYVLHGNVVPPLHVSSHGSHYLCKTSYEVPMLPHARVLSGFSTNDDKGIALDLHLSLGHAAP